MIERQQIFINGEWVDPSSDEVAVVINPATELPVASIRLGSPADVDQAVAAASAALPEWSHTSVEHRAQVLRSLADLIEVRADEASRTMTTEMGQPITTALGTTAGAIQDLRIFADALKDVVWSETVGGAEVHKVAAGVAGVITAWNIPLRTVAVKIGAALAAGCTTVLKGSEIAPLTSYLVADLAHQAGIPAGVFNLVSGTGPVVGEAIAAHPLVDMVSLTGSVRAGSRVMELASQSIKRVGLELGGKSANIILDDADVEKAVSVGIVDALRNGGQACGGLTRVLVPGSKLGAAEEAAASAAASFRLGDPLDPATTMGPMSNKGQRDRVRGYIRTGIDEGARLIVGGPGQPEGLDVGFYVKPTVFTGDNSMRIAREEIFGPVVVLIPFEAEAEAVNLANDSEYGLAGAVWSASPDRARAVASRIRTGRVVINGAPVERRPRMAASSVRASGASGDASGSRTTSSCRRSTADLTADGPIASLALLQAAGQASSMFGQGGHRSMAYQEALPESCMAAVVAELNQPVELRELPVPELEHGALLVKIEAATVCGTDLHIWDGAFGAGGIGQVNLPIVPGHEMVGRVAAFGPGEHADVTGSELKIGDRIVFTPSRCGSCHYCTVAGQPNLCTKRIGYGRQSAVYPYLVGGFAEYCYVYPTSSRIRVPDEVKPEWASAASCALRSVITGFRQLGAIEPWQTVVVQGSGPLGLFATAMAKRAGAARIIVVGDPAARLEVARAWGATETIPISSRGEPEDRVTAVRETTAGQGAEIVMEFSGARTAFTEGIAMVRRGGRYLVGGQVGPQEVPFRPTLITQNQLTITGSYSGSEAEYWRAIEFIRRAKDEYDFDQILSNRFRLDQVTDAFYGMQSMQEIKPVVIPEFA